ncbi:MAG: DUF3667 domain-containing protein [Saprospiraceae bacterium]|nr:DUF3667 domain-containing protein [Saprospiraceae bacterium]
MENESKSRRYCPNCYYPIEQNDHFCGQCGQKYTTGKIPLKELFQEFFESVLNLDAKIFHTIGALFIPGKLTIEYFKGRHNSYFRPLRIFFVMAIIHFAVISFSEFDGFNFNFNENSSKLDIKKESYRAVFLEEMDTTQQHILNKFNDNSIVNQAFDSLTVTMKGNREDSIEIGYLDFQRNFNIEGKDLVIAKKDMFELPNEELCDKYEVRGFMERLIVRQEIKLLADNASFSRYLIGQMIWMVILMMPALSLVLKLLYIRRKRYFVEHLVFSFHYHAFAFLIFTLAFLLLDWKVWQGQTKESDLTPPIVIAFSVVLIYLFMAMKRVYKQRVFKTFLKYSFLNFAYLIIFVVFLVGTVIASVLFF